jgi:hypothetical protein
MRVLVLARSFESTSPFPHNPHGLSFFPKMELKIFKSWTVNKYIWKSKKSGKFKNLQNNVTQRPQKVKQSLNFWKSKNQSQSNTVVEKVRN